MPFTADPLQNLKQMLIPAFILGTALSAITMRLTRTQMLEVLRQDYIRTAWAKGLMRDRHAAPRTAQRAGAGGDAGRPATPLLIGGAVIVEDLRHPGMGLLLLDAEPARLSDHHRRVPDRGRRRDGDQSRGRPELRPLTKRSGIADGDRRHSRAAGTPRTRSGDAFVLRLIRESRSARSAARCFSCSCSVACSPTCSHPTA